MIDDEYYVCVVTKEKGMMYAGRELTLVKNKENGLRFRHKAAVSVCRELKEMEQSQALTIVSTTPLFYDENRALQSLKKAKPQKIEPSGDFYVTPSRNKKPGPEDKINPETTEFNLRVEDNSVQSPAHYQLGGIEAIDVIDEAVADPASFYRGNAIKYLLRAGKKGDAHEDLRKARYYIDRELSHE